LEQQTDLDKSTSTGYISFSLYLKLLREFFIPAVQENTAPLVLRACFRQSGVPPSLTVLNHSWCELASPVTQLDTYGFLSMELSDSVDHNECWM